MHRKIVSSGVCRLGGGRVDSEAERLPPTPRLAVRGARWHTRRNQLCVLDLKSLLLE